MFDFIHKPSVHVLIVCTANVCRSPAAEAILNALSRSAGQHRSISIRSAGTAAATTPQPTDPRVLAILAERGVKLRGKKSKKLENSMLAKADFVWVMDGSQLDTISAEFPMHRDKYAFFDPGGAEIPDPYFGTKRDVRAALDKIETAALERHAQLGVEVSRRMAKSKQRK